MSVCDLFQVTFSASIFVNNMSFSKARLVKCDFTEQGFQSDVRALTVSCF